MQSAPAIDLSAIPAAQRAAVLALMETVAALTEITRRQEHLIAELNHALHGKRSEKLSEDERQRRRKLVPPSRTTGRASPRQSALSATCQPRCRALRRSSNLPA
jgi:hypothetical protein